MTPRKLSAFQCVIAYRRADKSGLVRKLSARVYVITYSRADNCAGGPA
jgi:hypothetical protein